MCYVLGVRCYVLSVIGGVRCWCWVERLCSVLVLVLVSVSVLVFSV